MECRPLHAQAGACFNRGAAPIVDGPFRQITAGTPDMVANSFHDTILDFLHEEAPELPVVARIQEEFLSLYQSEVASFRAIAEKHAAHIQRYAEFCEQIEAYWARYRPVYAERIGLELRPSFANVVMRHPAWGYLEAGDFFGRSIAQNLQRSSLPLSVGKALYVFLCADWLVQSKAFTRFNSGLLAPLHSHVTGTAGSERAWIDIGFGPAITAPGATERKEELSRSVHLLFAYLLREHGLIAARDFFYTAWADVVQPTLSDIYAVVTADATTLAQEYAHSLGLPTPNYSFVRSGGEEHEPLFTCTVSNPDFGHVTATAESKHAARKRAAIKLLDTLTEQHGPSSLRRLLGAKLLSGQIRGRAARPYRPSRSQVEVARVAIKNGAFTQPPERFIAALTTRGELSQGALSEADTNIRAAFAGSWLGNFLAWLATDCDDEDGGRCPIPDYSRMRSPLQKIRSYLWNTATPIGDRKCDDMMQALLYGEYVTGDFETVKNSFSTHCAVLDTKAHQREGFDLCRYDSGIRYTQALQEHLHQEGETLPSYEYNVLTRPSEAHRPKFKCTATVNSRASAGIGSTKSGAKNRAAFELLRALLRV